ncbi:MAG: phosphatase PAP2 family protein [Bacteroidia bacterium]|nr:phosphatase PAP2 family protein [Bacteroidia bacterium]
MKLLVKNNLILFILFGCFVISGGIAISMVSKQSLHLFFNSFVTKNLNGLFVNLTYLGDGIVVLCAVLVFAFINFRLFIVSALSYGLSSGIVQLLKNTLFETAVRPTHFFGALTPPIKLNLVPGIEMHGLNSFPSGHTASAFSIFFTLALLSQNKWVKIILFFVALFVGLSRVYLSQHFFEDIYGGAIIGVFFSVIIFYIFYFAPFSGRFNKLDTSVLKLIFSDKK